MGGGSCGRLNGGFLARQMPAASGNHHVDNRGEGLNWTRPAWLECQRTHKAQQEDKQCDRARHKGMHGLIM